MNTEHALPPIFRTVIACCTLLCSALLTITQAHATRASLESDRWYQLSVPAFAENSTVGGLFGDALPGDGYGKNWIVHRFAPERGAYVDPGLNGTIDAGEAVWIKQKTRERVMLDMPLPAKSEPVIATAPCASLNGCFRLPLSSAASGRQWSMVGVPFNQRTAIADIRFVNSARCARGCTLKRAAALGYVSPAILSHDGSRMTYVELDMADELAPWQGGWIAVNKNVHGTMPALLLPREADTKAPIALSNARIGRAIGLGNALEAPAEGAWGLTLQADYFDAIAEAGFDSVRVPIRWSAHAQDSAPYTIDAALFERIDWVLDQARRTDLNAIINMHHYKALMDDPAGQGARYLALWQQIAERYRHRSDGVYFELLNEPTGVFDERPEVWNALLADAVSVIRQSNPTRPLIVGPVGWNAIDRLSELSLPDDPNLIVTVHFYDPFDFTHQGADWVSPVPPLGTTWAAARTVLGAPFRDWSFDTHVQSDGSTLAVRFDRQYAGFKLHVVEPLTPESLTLSVQGVVDLDVSCGVDERLARMARVTLEGKAKERIRVDLRDCGPGVTDVVLQNRGAAPASMIVRGGTLCSERGCEPLLTTADRLIGAELDKARRWSDTHRRPIFVGEFGAYGTADMASRVEWTATVQSALQERSMSGSYWEFGAGFGAYDLANGRWNDELLEALMR